MEYRNLTDPGRMGFADLAEIKVSAMGLGCNAFGRRIDAAQSKAVIEAALDARITFFDTAESYGDGLSEEYIGRALGTRRADVMLATKFGWSRDPSRASGGGTKRSVEKSVEGSLKRLNTDWIDLYQLHKPDPGTPIAETLEAMDALVRAGKVRAIGCSNFSGVQLAEALSVSRQRGLAPFITAQNEYSVLDRGIEADLVPVCSKNGVGILPFYPLARGLLTAKYRRGEPAPQGSRFSEGGRFGGSLAKADFDMLEALEAFAKSGGRSLLDLAISWLASQPCVPCVISGATRPEQVRDNARSAEWVMTADELAEIDRITGHV